MKQNLKKKTYILVQFLITQKSIWMRKTNNSHEVIITN